MSTQKEFQILVRRKIPYLSAGLWSIMAVLILIILLFYVFMLPTKHASDEMKTAYYILVLPEWLKRLSALAFIGLLIFIPLYFSARLKRAALLRLTDDTILITGKQLDLTIPFKKIKRIYFNDLKNLFGQPKYKMQIVIQEKRNKSIVFFLANYEEAGPALDTLSKVNNAQFAFYDDNMETFHDDE